MSAVQSFWVETPLEVATHLQKFTAARFRAQLNPVHRPFPERTARQSGLEGTRLPPAVRYGVEHGMAGDRQPDQTKLLSAAQKPPSLESSLSAPARRLSGMH